MSADDNGVRIGSAQGGIAGALAAPDLDREQVRQLAQQFEALLMTQMLRNMRESMVGGEDEGAMGGGWGQQNGLTDTLDVELGLALSRAGGFGLSSSLLGAFERSTGVSLGLPKMSTPPPVEPSAGELSEMPVPEPMPTPSAGEPMLTLSTISTGPTAPTALQAGRISSAYGWRQDPMTGAPRFHAGVDIALPTGRDVVAAERGRVAFSGAQSDFGNTVVINHGAGRQTRYAHLSSLNVAAGDVVDLGQVIGKSGATGRATGPHLHFEVLLNGKAVNPLH